MKERSVSISFGGGHLARKLIFDLIQRKEPLVFGLVHMDEAASRMAERFSERMVALTGAPIKIQASTNRRDLLPGAIAVVRNEWQWHSALRTFHVDALAACRR